MPRIFYLLTVYALLVLHNTSLSSSLDVSDSDLLAKAEIYLYSYPDSAIFYLESYFQSSKENPQLARAYALMGKAFDIQSKYDSALYYYNLGVSLTSVSKSIKNCLSILKLPPLQMFYVLYLMGVGLTNFRYHLFFLL